MYKIDEELEVVALIEHPRYPGFFVIPGNDWIAINRVGVCISLLTGNPAKPQNGPGGYKTITVWRYGKSKTFYIHRLVALTFVGRPKRHWKKDFSELEVNHKDGDKSNYLIKNLEWVTPRENMIHASTNGLFNGEEVVAKNTQTLKEIRFPNATRCARYFGLNTKRFIRHLASPGYGRLTKDWYVFKYDDDQPWPVLTEKEKVKDSWDDIYVTWYAKSLETGDVVIADKLEELAVLLGFSYYAVATHRQEKGESVAYCGWIIQKDDAPLEDGVNKRLRGEKYSWKKPKPVVFENIKTKEVKKFPSIRVAAKETNIKEGKIIYSIKNGKIVNGCSLKYEE